MTDDVNGLVCLRWKKLGMFMCIAVVVLVGLRKNTEFCGVCKRLCGRYSELVSRTWCQPIYCSEIVSFRWKEPAERFHVCIPVFVFYFRCVGSPDFRETRQLFIWMPAILRLFTVSGFGGLEVACWSLVPKFAGSHPPEAVGFLGRKNCQHAILLRGSKAVGPMS